MRKPAAHAISLLSAGAVATALAQIPAPRPAPRQPDAARPGSRGGARPLMSPGPNPDSQYRLGPDSLPQDGVAKGEIRGPYTLPCRVYPGTQHAYWVYVPAQYDPAVPAALMIFQDGQAFKDDNGDLRAQADEGAHAEGVRRQLRIGHEPARPEIRRGDPAGDDAQNNANHIHTVWRDFHGDFGEDLLRRHYEASHSGGAH